MSDPTLGMMSIGLEACAIGVFVWASIDYNRFIKFWMLRTAPYSQRIKVAFRLFFLACVVGGVWRLAETMATSGRPAIFYLSALPFAAVEFVVFFLMLHVVERINQRRRIKQPRSPQQ